MSLDDDAALALPLPYDLPDDDDDPGAVHLAFDPSGTALAVALRGRVRVHSLRDGGPIEEYRTVPPGADDPRPDTDFGEEYEGWPEFSADGRWLAVAVAMMANQQGDLGVHLRVFDRSTGAAAHALVLQEDDVPPDFDLTEEDELHCGEFALAPDGARLAAAFAREPGRLSIVLLELHTGARRTLDVGAITSEEPLVALAFAPDSSALALSFDDELRVVACDDGRVLGSWRPPALFGARPVAWFGAIFGARDGALVVPFRARDGEHGVGAVALGAEPGRPLIAAGAARFARVTAARDAALWWPAQDDADTLLRQDLATGAVRALVATPVGATAGGRVRAVIASADGARVAHALRDRVVVRRLVDAAAR